MSAATVYSKSLGRYSCMSSWVVSSKPTKGKEKKQQNLYPLPDNKILAVFKLKAFADDDFSVVQKRCSFSLIGQKTLWKKEKMLVTSIFYFPAMFSKAFFSRVIENQELFGKGLQKEQECKESELCKVFFFLIQGQINLDTLIERPHFA